MPLSMIFPLNPSSENNAGFDGFTDADTSISVPVDRFWATSMFGFINLNLNSISPCLLILVGVGNLYKWDGGFKPFKELEIERLLDVNSVILPVNL